MDRLSIFQSFASINFLLLFKDSMTLHIIKWGVLHCLHILINWLISVIINYHKRWPRTRITHPRTKTIKTIRTALRSPGGRNTVPLQESTRNSWEIEEELSEMIPASIKTTPLLREFRLSKQEIHDSYLNHPLFIITIFLGRSSIAIIYKYKSKLGVLCDWFCNRNWW